MAESFKVGQRVRVTKQPFGDDGGLQKYGGHAAGDVVTVEGVENEFVDVRSRDGTNRRYFASRFEPIAEGFAAVAPPIPPKFKAGDRVRLVSTYGFLQGYGLNVGSFATVKEFIPAYVSFGRAQGPYVSLVETNGGGSGLEHFELAPLPVPAPAAKFATTIYVDDFGDVGESPSDFDGGEEVGIYQLVRVGRVKESTSYSVE